MTKQQFWKNGVSGSTKGLVIAGGVISLLCGGLNVLTFISYLSMGYMSNAIFVALDMVVFLALGLGLLLARSRVCAVIVGVWYFIGRILILAMSNISYFTIALSIIFIGLYVMGIIGSFNFHKEYNQMMFYNTNNQNNNYDNYTPYQ